jgi:hypothetical protein
MSEIQAIYDAVRSRISNCDSGEVISRAVRESFDVSHQVSIVAQEFINTAMEQSRPSVLFRPRIFLDGNEWCALYGENLQDGIAGFGKSPALAMSDFDKNWTASL